MAKLTLPERELVEPGHLACQGCGAALAMRLFLKGTGPDTALVIPACCWAVIAGPMPTTCLKVPTAFSAFEATASVASGIKAGLRRTGRGETLVAGFAGDGGTADIGIQALSGAAERNEDMIYVCYDNEAYMNTGIQRSGSTLPGTWTTTTPAGVGKTTPKKDMPAIMAAHAIPYVATLNPSFPEDFVAKVKKAASMHGLRYLHVLADCPTGWKHDPSLMVKVGRLATTSHLWPLYEVVEGAYRVTWEPSNPTPLEEYLKLQGRFAGMSPAEVASLKKMVEERWKALKARTTTGTLATGSSPPSSATVAPVPSSPSPRAPAPASTSKMGPPAISATSRAEAAELPLCYKTAKRCDGSCGMLQPGGLCWELFALGPRHF
ncbi:MAG: pyruvate synthase subunit beta [Euryarchaeota archaeon]|nr:pyruvate synthase subunit beta [Euryarchaeota archaeon]